VLLLHKKFPFIREKCINGKTYWRCTQYTTKTKCHGRLHVLNGKIVHIKTHNHSPLDQERKQYMKLQFNDV